MGHEIDLNKYNIRTDLILESITDNDNYIDTKTENYGNISVLVLILMMKVVNLLIERRASMLLFYLMMLQIKKIVIG